MPPRLARVMIEQKPKPPPPPPPVVEQPKPKPPEPDKKVAMVKPPVDVKQQAREKAQKQLNQVKDELADLREQLDMTSSPRPRTSRARWARIRMPNAT